MNKKLERNKIAELKSHFDYKQLRFKKQVAQATLLQIGLRTVTKQCDKDQKT